MAAEPRGRDESLCLARWKQSVSGSQAQQNVSELAHTAAQRAGTGSAQHGELAAMVLWCVIWQSRSTLVLELHTLDLRGLHYYTEVCIW